MGTGCGVTCHFFECFRLASLGANKIWCSLVVRAETRTYLKSKGNGKCEKQISPLCCGMTTKKNGNGNSKCKNKSEQRILRFAKDDN